jgi:LytS/YehU family sensor histidine kinase
MIEYTLKGPGGFQEWKKNDLDESLIWLRDLPPGKYKLFIRYSFQRHNVTEYEFEIGPAWHQTTFFKLGAGSLTAASFGFIFLLFKTRRQKQRLRAGELEKEITQTELKAIRSQLNPHFIFNSLSSIQGLVNKKDLPGANYYLSQFSELMRSALKGGDKEFVPVSTEISTIESYLRLEQLRFGFQYSIHVEKDIQATEIEVPALLLQPLLENAVKHGVATLAENGKVKLTVGKKEDSLVMSIRDNGKGFSSATDHDGYGLKLTEARIALLNKTLNRQSIQLMIENNTGSGVSINLIFHNWL